MMKLTAKGRYAVNAILEMAMNKEQRPLSIAEISRHQNISQSYLEQLFAKLRHKGLLKAVRGPGGGYLINGNFEDISIAQIIMTIEEECPNGEDLVHEREEISDCRKEEQTNETNEINEINEIRREPHISWKHKRTGLDLVLWDKLNEEVHKFLNSVSLAKIVSQAGLD